MKSADIAFKGVTKKRILLADDEPAMVMVMKFRLEHEGFEVVVATDGEEALHQAVANGVIDLILLDIKMPKLDGFQVCKRLKENPATAKIPIIIFTASEGVWSQLADRCVEFGVTGWLKKPYGSQELLKTIRQALGSRKEDQ